MNLIFLDPFCCSSPPGILPAQCIRICFCLSVRSSSVCHPCCLLCSYPLVSLVTWLMALSVTRLLSLYLCPRFPSLLCYPSSFFAFYRILSPSSISSQFSLSFSFISRYTHPVPPPLSRLPLWLAAITVPLYPCHNSASLPT